MNSRSTGIAGCDDEHHRAREPAHDLLELDLRRRRRPARAEQSSLGARRRAPRRRRPRASGLAPSGRTGASAADDGLQRRARRTRAHRLRAARDDHRGSDRDEIEHAQHVSTKVVPRGAIVSQPWLTSSRTGLRCRTTAGNPLATPCTDATQRLRAFHGEAVRSPMLAHRACSWIGESGESRHASQRSYRSHQPPATPTPGTEGPPALLRVLEPGRRGPRGRPQGDLVRRVPGRPGRPRSLPAVPRAADAGPPARASASARPPPRSATRRSAPSSACTSASAAPRRLQTPSTLDRASAGGCISRIARITGVGVPRRVRLAAEVAGARLGVRERGVDARAQARRRVALPT